MSGVEKIFSPTDLWFGVWKMGVWLVKPPGLNLINHLVMEETFTVKVWRGNQQGRLQTYQISVRENQTVLDVITEVQRLHQLDLAYRFSCRVDVCGS